MRRLLISSVSVLRRQWQKVFQSSRYFYGEFFRGGHRLPACPSDNSTAPSLARSVGRSPFRSFGRLAGRKAIVFLADLNVNPGAPRFTLLVPVEDMFASHDT